MIAQVIATAEVEDVPHAAAIEKGNTQRHA